MNLALSDTLYLALGCSALGTLAALLSLFVRENRLQHTGLILMIPESLSFVAWLVFAIELALWIRYRVYAASFFVYPLVLLMLTVSAVIGEQFKVLDPGLRSNLFTTHLLLSTVGVAGLLIGLAFGLLALLQDRALKRKTRGPLWDWIPSLDVCKTLSYRALAIGFSIYTLGLIAGVLWSYRTHAGFMDLRVKQIGAVTAWVLFAVLLQSYVNNTYRRKRMLFVSAGAFVAILVAMLGIDV